MRALSYAAALGTFFLVHLLTTGCVSQPLPPPISAHQRAIIDTARIPLVVGVHRGRFPPVYAASLVESLKRTNVFARVDLLERVPEAQLVATVKRPVYGSATIPILTALSLGLIPTITTEEWGDSFTIATRDRSRRPVPVELTWRGRTILGWVAGLANLSPNRTSAPPGESERYGEALAAAILRQRTQIEALVR